MRKRDLETVLEVLLKISLKSSRNSLYMYFAIYTGLHVVDVSDPYNPVSLSCNGDDDYIHDAECFRYDGPDER